MEQMQFIKHIVASVYFPFLGSRNKRIYPSRRWRNVQSISPVAVHAMKIINRNFVESNVLLIRRQPCTRVIEQRIDARL